jgi:hypothetical protein
MVAQSHPRRMTSPALDDSLIQRYHLDLDTLGVIGLVTEDLAIRRRGIIGTRPTPRDIERLAAIAARIEREGAR